MTAIIPANLLGRALHYYRLSRAQPGLNITYVTMDSTAKKTKLLELIKPPHGKALPQNMSSAGFATANIALTGQVFFINNVLKNCNQNYGKHALTDICVLARLVLSVTGQIKKIYECAT